MVVPPHLSRANTRVFVCPKFSGLFQTRTPGKSTHALRGVDGGQGLDGYWSGRQGGTDQLLRDDFLSCCFGLGP